MTEEDQQGVTVRKQVLCPACRAFASRIAFDILDPRNGMTVRIYRCDCGQHIWDDYPLLA